MKGKRQKHLRKCLTFYEKNFGYKPPYKLLIDGTFCKAALKFKVNIMEQMPKYLGGEVKYFTTKCCLAECEALGKLLYGPLKVLRQYHVHHCGHSTPISPIKCVRDVMKRFKRTFFICTQDTDLSDRVRGKSGIPLLYIAFNTITLESPTDFSKQTAVDRQARNVIPSDHVMKVIKRLKTATFGEEEVIMKKKRKKAKGKNPLSCKPKKKRNAKEKKNKRRPKVKKQKVTLKALVSSQAGS